MPKPKGRGRVLKTRNKRLPGNKFLKCDVMEKPGPRKGKTVCHVHKKKSR